MLFNCNSGGGGMGRNRTNAGLGSGGSCVCTNCGTVVGHKSGVPCYEMQCPKCGATMTRDGLVNQQHAGRQTLPIVSKDICSGCGKCVPACPYGAIDMVDGKAIINTELCTGCRKCIAVCPVGAIN